MESKTANLSNNTSSTRLSNLELLRIVAMFIIVAHHFSVHSAFNYDPYTISLSRLWIQFIQLGGKLGVNIFVLISGYFLINTDKLKISKLIKLWLQLLTYSLGSSLVLVLLGEANFDAIDFLKMCFPVTIERWWFASAYFVMFLLSPFINKFLHALDKNTFKRFLILLFAIWCIVPTLTDMKLQSNYLLWFIFMYSIAAYIRLWHDNTDTPAYKYYLFTIAMIAFALSLTVFFDYAGLRRESLLGYATHYYDLQCLQTVLIALGMFLSFKNMKMKHSKIINILSSATFGIYLIHDDVYTRPLIWRELFNSLDYADSIMIIPYSIAVICFIYIACTCIELLRIYVLEKNYMKLVYKAQPTFERWIEKFMSIKFIDRL